MMGSLTVFSDDVSASETKASESITVVMMMMMMQLCGGFMHQCWNCLSERGLLKAKSPRCLLPPHIWYSQLEYAWSASLKIKWLKLSWTWLNSLWTMYSLVSRIYLKIHRKMWRCRLSPSGKPKFYLIASKDNIFLLCTWAPGMSGPPLEGVLGLGLLSSLFSPAITSFRLLFGNVEFAFLCTDSNILLTVWASFNLAARLLMRSWWCTHKE